MTLIYGTRLIGQLRPLSAVTLDSGESEVGANYQFNFTTDDVISDPETVFNMLVEKLGEIDPKIKLYYVEISDTELMFQISGSPFPFTLIFIGVAAVFAYFGLQSITGGGSQILPDLTPYLILGGIATVFILGVWAYDKLRKPKHLSIPIPQGF